MKRIYIEITNACNLNCPFCTNKKGNEFMSLKQIEYYFSQAKEYTDNIYLHVLGEPLLHPNIDEIFDLATQYNLKINLVTNGTLLHKHKSIIDMKSLRKISISIHSINNIDINNNYYSNIIDIIDKNKDKYIELRLFDIDNLNDKNKEFLNILKNKYEFSITNTKNNFKLKDNTYINFGSFFKWPDINDKYINNIGYCHGAIEQLAILHNGEVTICCLDPKGFNSIGNLNDNTLKEILSSQKYLNIIKGFKNKQIINDLCKKCTYRLRFTCTND